ncbi:MAG: hypothetical protein EAX87_01920 [Candidatus Thorarchaeota archaeon]|nr:hypothetical protein [Candidatus Thorarchaeota archaeon]
MDTCFLPLVYLLIISLMYLKWPQYGKEIWNCLKRYSSLRACDVDFHDKARATLTSIVMRRSIRLGRSVYRNFEVISVFSVLAFVYFMMRIFIDLFFCVVLLLPA